MTQTVTKMTNIFRFKNVLEWLNMPANRSYDIIGIGHINGLSSLGVAFQMEYCHTNGGWVTSSGYYPLSTTTGDTATFKLPASSISGLKITIQKDVKKANSNDVITYVEACGDYSHSTSSISSTLARNHSIDLSGIVLNSSNATYFDSIQAACAYWNGTW